MKSSRQYRIAHQTIEKWEKVSRSHSYQRAKVSKNGRSITEALSETLFDGCDMALNERHSKKSYQGKVRILRRIVEKRQAQSVHRVLNNFRGRYAHHLVERSVCLSMYNLSPQGLRV